MSCEKFVCGDRGECGCRFVPPGSVHQGYLLVSYQELAKLLNLPADAEIIGVSGETRFCSNQIVVKVAHPNLPATSETGTLPQVPTESKSAW